MFRGKSPQGRRCHQLAMFRRIMSLLLALKLCAILMPISNSNSFLLIRVNAIPIFFIRVVIAVEVAWAGVIAKGAARTTRVVGKLGVRLAMGAGAFFVGVNFVLGFLDLYEDLDRLASGDWLELFGLYYNLSGVSVFFLHRLEGFPWGSWSPDFA
jgi:hypothetical protein